MRKILFLAAVVCCLLALDAAEASMEYGISMASGSPRYQAALIEGTNVQVSVKFRCNQEFGPVKNIKAEYRIDPPNTVPTTYTAATNPSPVPDCDCDPTKSCSFTFTMNIPASLPLVPQTRGSTIYFMIYGKQGLTDVWYTSDYQIIQPPPAAGTVLAPPQPPDTAPPPELPDILNLCKDLGSGYDAEGTHCWQYSEGSYVWDTSKFVCDSKVQVNLNKHCIATCHYWPITNLCKCSFKEACVEDCREGVIFGGTCIRKLDFACPAPEYDCPSGVAGPVACATTTECKGECAASCGSSTGCFEDCQQCCAEETCKKTTYTKDEFEACMRTCRGMCKANEELCNTAALLAIIGGAIDIVMLIIHGLRFMMSEDPAARKDARDGVVYVLFGSLAVVLAAVLVGVMLGLNIPTCFMMLI